jgi:hypothetical protein
MAMMVLSAILAVLVILLVANGFYIMRAKDKPENKNKEGEDGDN